MPYKPEQARAIAAQYRRRGKPIPEHVKREIAKATRGRPMKRKRASARDELARKRAMQKQSKRHRRRR
jgi:hypothetical protein